MVLKLSIYQEERIWRGVKLHGFQTHATLSSRNTLEAEEMKKNLEKEVIKLHFKGGSTGKLFGSVTNIDIANKISEEKGIEIDKRKIDLKKAIKEAGIYDVKIKLYGSVEANVKIEVVV